MRLLVHMDPKMNTELKTDGEVPNVSWIDGLTSRLFGKNTGC